MSECEQVPLDPMDSVFQIDGKPFVLVCKDDKEYVMAPMKQVGRMYYKCAHKFMRFPESTIAGISDQCGFVRARDLPNFPLN